MPAPTPAQVNAAQGTRLEERAPWETYDANFEQDVSPELAGQIAEYATQYHDNSSNQNKEELARWKEENDSMMGEYKWCTTEEYADVQARIGEIINHSDLITRLRKIGVRCWYRHHPQADKVTLVVLRNDWTEPEVGCWVKYGWMPEYTVMGFDEHGVPLAERYRGWRTAILQLILKGMITETKAHKEFGPAERCCAERYNSILYGLRNTLKTN